MLLYMKTVAAHLLAVFLVPAFAVALTLPFSYLFRITNLSRFAMFIFCTVQSAFGMVLAVYFAQLCFGYFGLRFGWILIGLLAVTGIYNSTQRVRAASNEALHVESGTGLGLLLGCIIAGIVTL
jgi:hypothetical protein